MKLHVEGFGCYMDGYVWFASGPVRNLKREASEDMKALRQIIAEHKQLLAENAALKKDAERYRWLTNQSQIMKLT